MKQDELTEEEVRTLLMELGRDDADMSEIITEEEITSMLSPKPLTDEQEAEIKAATQRFVEKFMAGEYGEVPVREPCMDAISREDAIKAMYGLCGDGSLKDNPWRDNPNIDAIVDALQNLPSVQPERQRGRWSFHYSKEDGLPDGCECSECKEYFYFGGNRPKFCPSCGADMRKEDAE